MSFTESIFIFVICAIAIALLGTRMAKISDRLADRTGMGEAIIGAVFLGGSTSLSGIVTSVTAATTNHPGLAISNAIGGMAAQTAFLAIADLFYRRANLEHAAASVANLIQGTLLITLLSLPLLAIATPEMSLLGWIHPVSGLLVIGYILGLFLTSQVQAKPMWRPRRTEQTRFDEPEEGAIRDSLLRLWGQFIILAGLLGEAGYFVAKSGLMIAEKTGLSESVMGGIFTAVITSLPELVTTVAAVREGALMLAVGGVMGGNSFDVLFLAISDLAYDQGSIYQAISTDEIFAIALTILITSILLLGLLRREKYGLANIGFESFFVLVCYFGGYLFLFFR